MNDIKLFLVGEGGQGIQTIAKIISDSASSLGYKVTYIPSFGVEQRGTPSAAFITVSKSDIRYPKFVGADIAVLLSKRATGFVEHHLLPTTKLLFDSSTVPSVLLSKKVALLGVPATEIASKEFVAKAFNIIVTGKLSQLLGFDATTVWKSIEKTLGKKFKTDKIREMNKKAFDFGVSFIPETRGFTKPSFMPEEKDIIRKGFGKRALIIPKRCKGCGICIAKCPVAALTFGETLGVFSTPVPEIDLDKCIGCGNCYRFCPDAAIHVEKDSIKKSNK